jgi:hypothetical protein
MSDNFGIVANVVQDKSLRNGAKVWVLDIYGDGASVRVRGLSKGGRRITKFIHIKRLMNFRPEWMPAKLLHVLGGSPCVLNFNSKIGVNKYLVARGIIDKFAAEELDTRQLSLAQLCINEKEQK